MKFKHSLLIFAVCSGLSFNMVTAVGPGSSKSENTQDAFETYFNTLKTFGKVIKPELLESCLKAHITDETELIIKVINQYAQFLLKFKEPQEARETFLVYAGGTSAYNFLVRITKFVVTWFADCYGNHEWLKEKIEKEVNELNTLWINQYSMTGILKFLNLENETIPAEMYEKLRATHKNSERPTEYTGSTAEPQAAIAYPQSPEEYKKVVDTLDSKFFKWICKPQKMKDIYDVLTELAEPDQQNLNVTDANPGQQNQIDKAKQLTTLKELIDNAKAKGYDDHVNTLLRILKSNCTTGK